MFVVKMFSWGRWTAKIKHINIHLQETFCGLIFPRNNFSTKTTHTKKLDTKISQTMACHAGIMQYISTGRRSTRQAEDQKHTCKLEWPNSTTDKKNRFAPVTVPPTCCVFARQKTNTVERLHKPALRGEVKLLMQQETKVVRQQEQTRCT